MGLRAKHRERFYLELSKLMAAGFPPTKAINTLRDQKMPGEIGLVSLRLSKSILEQPDLAGAMEQALGSNREDLDIALIRAGEKAGRVPDALQQLADHYGRRARTSRKVRAQMIYPAILLHFGVFLPMLPKAIKENSSIPLQQAGLILLGLWVFLFLAYGFYQFLRKRSTHKVGTDRLLRKVPLYGSIRKFSSLSRFADVLGAYLNAGLVVSTSLRAAGKSSASAVLLNDASTAAAKIEEGGNNLAQAIAYAKSLPSEFARGLATSEQSGTLTEELERWSKLYAEETEIAAVRFGTWVPRILYFIIAGFVVYQIVTMYMGYVKSIMQFL